LITKKSNLNFRSSIIEQRLLTSAGAITKALKGKALPATGGFDAASLIGTLLAGTGVLFGVRLRRKH
jgi:LPXTG-motif cell wall-anchored protein